MRSGGQRRCRSLLESRTLHRGGVPGELSLAAPREATPRVAPENKWAIDAFDGQRFSQAFVGVFAAGVGASIDSAASMMGVQPAQEEFEPLTWAIYEMGKQVSGPVYLLAHALLQRTARDVAAFMQNYDVILTPTLAEPPLPLGTFDSPPENPLAGLARATRFVAFTPIANATGQPAMSVPLYWNGEGLPVGVHFIGRFGDEATLFRLAAQLEAARPWDARRPPVFA